MAADPDTPRPLVHRPLDLYRLQQFLQVAEHRGFTRAAAELHVTQQALSSAVHQLERQLDATLFDRTGRRVELTAAGRVLSDGARTLLAAAESLSRSTRAAAHPQPLPFVVGHTPAITAEEVFDLIEPARRQWPDVSFTVRQMFPDEFSSALHDGTIDLGLRRGVTAPSDLSAAVIAFHRLRIAVAAGHEFAGRASVAIADLAEQTLVVWAPPGSSFYTDFILSTCRRSGYEPRFVVNRVQGTPPVTGVADNDGVAFVTAPSGPAMGGRVMVIDVREPLQVPTQALWLPHTVSAVRDAVTVVPPTAPG